MKQSVGREVAALARLLFCEADELGGLAALPAADLQLFREQITDHLRRSEANRFLRLSQLSTRVPATVAVTVTATVIPPVIAARLAQTIEPRQAAAIANRLPLHYLTAMAREIAPDACRALLDVMHPNQVSRVAVTLLDHGDYSTVGRWVPVLPSGILAAVIEPMSGATITRLVCAIDPPATINTLIDHMPDTLLHTLLDAVPDRWVGKDLATIRAALDESRMARIHVRHGRCSDAPANENRPHLGDDKHTESHP
ncbi:hypothetical protein [Nocardia brasiliensis]|uniref:hypothetical protein n=1 Tax=Nocardia brasiliensis TaxID=37326 RepID=UPI003D92261F